MSNGTRKATDVLLDIESKVDVLVGLVRSQDLVIKILSNKLNEVVTRMDKQQAGPPKITVETVQTPHPNYTVPAGFTGVPAGDPERNIPYAAEAKLLQTDSPQGFRRNSRPETYVKEKTSLQDKQMPVQLPPNIPHQRQDAPKPPPGRSNDPETVIHVPAIKETKNIESEQQMAPQGQVPVSQRCVDKNGKSIFLASVEIVDMSTNQQFFKTKTNATGKWFAALPIGNYTITIKKLESVTKEKVESVQTVKVDGSQSKLDLPMLIIR